MKARNAALNETPWSSTTSVKTLTTRPDSLALSFIGSTSVQVAWGSGINPPGTLFSVQISTGNNFSAAPASIVGGNSHVLAGLSPNKLYFYRVANKDYVSYPSEFVTGFLYTRPNLPAAQPFSFVTLSAVTPNWTDNGNPAGTEYLVTASSDASSAGSVNLIFAASQWQTALSTSFVSLSPNVTHYFRVKARNSLQMETGYLDLGSTVTLAAPTPRPQVTGGYDEVFGYGYYFRVTPSFGQNSPDTELAIKKTGTQEYLQGNGTFDTLEVWKTKSQWESGFLTNIATVTAGSTLSFVTVSRNFNTLRAPDSASQNGTLPPSQPATPIISQSDSANLRISNYFTVPGADSYWIYTSIFSSAPAPSLVFLASAAAPTFDDAVPCLPPSAPALSVTTATASHVMLSWTASNAPACGPRFYKVSAADSQGQTGQKSQVGSGSSSINPNISEYGIYRDGLFIASAAGSASTYTDSSVSQGSSYQYSIVARTTQGSLSLSTPSASAQALTPVTNLAITGREIYDTDNDGLGDTIKITFNQPLVDSTVGSASFLVGTVTGKASANPDNIPNDNALSVYVGNLFKGDDVPAVKYAGGGITSTLGKVLSPESSSANALDKVAPVIEQVGAVSLNSRTVLRVRFSEPVQGGTVGNLSKWALEAPPGTPVSLAGAGIAFDNPKTVALTIPHELGNTNSFKVLCASAPDIAGNARTSTAYTSFSVLKAPHAFSVVKDAQGRKSQGNAVHASVQLTLFFDREMNPVSLQNGIALFMVQDKLGNSVFNPVPGNVQLLVGNQMMRFVPSAALPKGSKYRVVTSSALTDAFGYSRGEEYWWEFYTAADYTEKTVISMPGFKFFLNPGTFNEDAGLALATDPENNAQYANRAVLSSAFELERRKAEQAGNGPHAPIPSLAFEIVGETPAGNILQGRLGSPVQVSITYPDADNDNIIDGTNPGVAAKDLELYFLDENLGEFRKVASTVNPNTQTITASLSHFSVYALMGALSTNVNSFLVRPNLWEPRKDPLPVILDNLPDPSEINVYSVTGQKVRTLINSGQSSIEWNGSSDSGEPLASGVYVLVLKGAGGTKSKKLTIVR